MSSIHSSVSGIPGFVSVTIPFLNADRFLSEAIESVLKQTYTQWELLLVDDGSTDGSTAIALQYASKFPEKISYLEHPGHANRGLPASRNRGARRGKGEFLAFLDADDAWLPHMLEEHVAILTAHPEAGLACSPSEYWYDWENNPAELKRNEIPPIAPGNQLYDPPQLLYRCYPLGPLGSPCPCSLVLRRGAYEGVGGFEETFNPQTRQLFEDMAFLAKIYLAYPVFVSRNCQSRYRQHALSMSSRVESDGSYEIERRYYFQWLMGYLVKQRVRDFATWKALIRRSLTSWLPFSRSITGRMKTPRERS